MNEFYNKMKYFEETEGYPREIYYHYTSVNSLYSIIQNKTFWLTSLNSSNDKYEMKYAQKQFIDDFTKLIFEEADNNIKAYLLLLKESYSKNEQAFKQQISETKYPYALSLSTKKDNLTHWDRYANSCTGVSIGINVSAFKVLYSRMNSEIFGDALFDIGSVIYGDSRRQYLRNCTIKASGLIQEMLKKDENRKLKDMILLMGHTLLASVYLRMANFVKSDDFGDESEARIFFNAASPKSTLKLIDSMKNELNTELYENIRKHFLEIISSFGIEAPCFSVFRNGIREYRKLCLQDIWGSGLIPEIYIGPLCSQNKSELRRFLKNSGLEGAKIIQSSVPIQ